MKAGRLIVFLGIIFASIGLFLFLQSSNTIDVIPESKTASTVDVVEPVDLDIGPQKPLANPPEIIKAIYATSWSAASATKLNYLINLIKETELNAIVIDVKDFTGYLSYNTKLDLAKKYNAVELRIQKLNELVKKLHDENIYVIGRISVFQDQQLAKARPDLALHSAKLMEQEYGTTTIWWKPGSENSSSEINEIARVSTAWKDNKGLMWMDTASKEVWDYNIAIAREILERGFDEANFDYVRFASDGNLDDIKHPVWDEKTLKTHIVRDFFKYLRDQLLGYKLSADLFGLVTIETNGMGIGQHLEYALPYFDSIAPMVYPSHYYKGFIGYENPANAPYEVVKYSMDKAVQRAESFKIYASTTPMNAKFRPWIQDFDLGAEYDAEKVRAQINAWNDSVANTPELNGGWMLWNPSNIYTREALNNESR